MESREGGGQRGWSSEGVEGREGGVDRQSKKEANQLLNYRQECLAPEFRSLNIVNNQRGKYLL